MVEILASVGLGILGAVSGLCVFVYVVNRLLSYLKDSRVKTAVIPPLFFLCVAGLGWIGYVYLNWWSLATIGIILLWAIIGEYNRIRFQRKYRRKPLNHESIPDYSFRNAVTTTHLVPVHYQISLPEWRGEPFRIVQISDLHVTHAIPLSYYQRVIEVINQAEPHLVLITGDFVTEAGDLHLLHHFLGEFKAAKGVYAIMGNHDYWCCVERIKESLMQLGVHYIGGSWAEISFSREERLLLGGCETPWGLDLPAEPAQTSECLRIVLSHSADQVYKLANRGARVVFSGHYHAGQIHIPPLGALIVPSAFGRRLLRGHYLIGSTHLFVSAGAGAAKPPFRLFCYPDVVIVDLFSAGFKKSFQMPDIGV